MTGDSNLEEYSNDALAEMADGLAKEAERLFRLARGARDELRVRMRANGATVLETEHWHGVLKPGPLHHAVDAPDRFRQRLVPLVGADDIRAAFVQPPAPAMRVDHRVINTLVKRGGLIAKIIDEERRSIRDEDVLVLERKPEAKA